MTWALGERGQTERAPHPRNRRLRDIEMLGHRACGPACLATAAPCLGSTPDSAPLRYSIHHRQQQG
ncbi:hypothetical protein Rhow_002897 [Rhodococcus wratislaviensis]|uniref:Uncharacterized protein n=1 Tax=Rhodococcus wratislaviensis TaxID=44752 RepID=A0A402C713_RHOWR|nr:hypothetical protein Rhow_002897 [Rhodococcus wratislaviensis]